MNTRIVTIGIGLALVILVADQLTKHFILEAFLPGGVETGEVRAVFPFFNLRLVWNYGVSFGMFAKPGSAMPYLLMAVALAIVAFLMHWLSKTDRTATALGIGLVTGGAIGNVIDRVRFGAVVDFLDFHWQGWHYPAFNIADSAIVIGALWLMLDSFKKTTKDDAKA